MDSYRIRGARLVWRQAQIEAVPIGREDHFYEHASGVTQFRGFKTRPVEVPDGRFIAGDILDFETVHEIDPVTFKAKESCQCFRLGDDNILRPVARGSWE